MAAAGWLPAEAAASFPALRLARSSRLARRAAKVLLVFLAAGIAALAFAPWQQSVSGVGRVVAYSPLERQQSVKAPISGRVDRYGEGLYDGARVTKGQFILEIQDNDPDLPLRQREQLEATLRELETSNKVVQAYVDQVTAFETAREQSVEAADDYIEIAKEKLRVEERGLEAETAGELQARLDFDRQKELEKDGLSSTLKVQEAERKWKEAVTKVEKAKAYIRAAQNEVDAKMSERIAKEREAQAKVDSSNATLEKARGDVAKLEKQIAELKVKIAQLQSQVVTAPRDGAVMHLMAFSGGEIVKQGDPLFVLIPDAEERAAEIWVNGNDAPLIGVGRPVRLQFEGWPAVQFAGWPSVAVGTFGGKVANVDAAAGNAKNQFRVLVVPDENSPPWPSTRFLRQGTRANGWVLLDEVGLGYEAWRRLNGFPPAVGSAETSNSAPSGSPSSSSSGK
jgi:adhesin transport system membrane fusion protein